VSHVVRVGGSGRWGGGGGGGWGGGGGAAKRAMDRAPAKLM
jgi:hypothetical protein